MTSDNGEAVTVSHGDMEEQNGETEESGEETVNVAKPRETGPTFTEPVGEDGEIVEVYEAGTGETKKMVWVDGELVPVNEEPDGPRSDGNPTMPGGEPGQEIEPEPEPEPDVPHMEDRVALLEDRVEELHEALHNFVIKTTNSKITWDHFPDKLDGDEWHELPCGHESFHESELPSLGGNTVDCDTCGGKWKSREIKNN